MNGKKVSAIPLVKEFVNHTALGATFSVEVMPANCTQKILRVGSINVPAWGNRSQRRPRLLIDANDLLSPKDFVAWRAGMERLQELYESAMLGWQTTKTQKKEE